MRHHLDTLIGQKVLDGPISMNAEFLNLLTVGNFEITDQFWRRYRGQKVTS